MWAGMGLDALTVAGVPQPDAAVLRGGRHPRAVRAPCQASHLVSVARQRLQTLSCGRIPQLSGFVHAASGQPLALIVPAHDAHVLVMRGDALELLARGGVPQADGGRAAAGDELAVVAPMKPCNTALVPLQSADDLIGGRIEEAHNVIVRARGERHVARRRAARRDLDRLAGPGRAEGALAGTAGSSKAAAKASHGRRCQRGGRECAQRT
mmetsp:Transcript_1214/g.2834  ORF Transcript_1214/g.2834 Transcript_1214/m.2834 type:complete len:210 (+) Transcript_1214:436-1065(+)